MKYGFIRAAAAAPALSLANCPQNARAIIDCMKKACHEGVRFLVLPELCITGYTCGDLFLQKTLLDAAEEALLTILRETADLDMLTAVGLPLRITGKLYNCAAVCHKGRLLGIIPKTHLPNYGPFAELRHFVPAPDATLDIGFHGMTVPFGTKLLFTMRDLPAFTAAFEICEDLWAPNSPSTAHAMAGAALIGNLSASPETVGKDDWRRTLVTSQSAKLQCSYVYADAGLGESSTDLVFAGHNLIAEDGLILSESLPFGAGYAAAEIDVDKLTYERMRVSSFNVCPDSGYTRVYFDMALADTGLTCAPSRHPFIPEDAQERERRCEMILNIQAAALARRIEHAYAKTAVVGISGGLDSCLALLVAVRAMERLGRPASDVLAVTMPCFGTTKRTRSNAEILTLELGAQLRCIDIAAVVNQHFADIGHDPDNHNVVFENAQARARTYILMDLANQTGGMVIGTGDLSELALGWATYNGDHMSMYGVNASVPKTLIRCIVRHCAEKAASETLRRVLIDIVDTPVSPELLPVDEGKMTQITEDIVGPYELH
ncbi:MAG: NAD(+) synthase, partial [Clostridia bacterium]|nr:NAD(+) synthase [Clostridia bacterium]